MREETKVIPSICGEEWRIYPSYSVATNSKSHENLVDVESPWLQVCTGDVS